jgi:hypothetical protein
MSALPIIELATIKNQSSISKAQSLRYQIEKEIENARTPLFKTSILAMFRKSKVLEGFIEFLPWI